MLSKVSAKRLLQIFPKLKPCLLYNAKAIRKTEWLAIQLGTNKELESSISAQNPFEVVDFTTTSNADLTIEIYRYANSGTDNVILGYTLWNDF